MTKPSTSRKVGPPRKAAPPRKVGPARAAKTNHKFGKSKASDTLPVADGSVGDGSPEPSPTNKDSGALADDTTVVDLCLPTDDELVVPDSPDVPVLLKKRKLRQRRKISSAAREVDEHSSEASPEGSDYEQSEPGSNDDDADKSPVPSRTQPDQEVDEDRVSPAPPARRAKGKGREQPPPADDEDLHDVQHQVDLDDGQQQVDLDDGQQEVDLDENSGDSLLSGRLPQEAIDKAVALGDKTVAEAENIAKEYGKSTRTILIQAGLAVKTTRADNSWNMYQAWYKMKYPKSSDMSTNDWKQMQRDRWLKDSDQRENPELWKEVREFWDGSSRIAEESSKALYNRVMAVCDAFALSCQAYSRLEDIYVGGFVLYTGTAEAGRRAAGVFAGSPLILDLVNKKQADIKELFDYLTTVIKYNRIDDTASLPSFTRFTAPKFNPELSCEKGEGTRDRNRCVAPIMMVEKFESVGIPHEAKNIPWKTMLNSLYLHQAQVVDWPAGVPPVGSDFVFKDLKTDELKALVGPYLKHCMGSDYNAELARVEHPELKKKRKDQLSGVKVPEQELMFVPWSDESKDLMSNEDSDMLNIPLITDTDGKVQCTLMDCVLFMKNLLPNIEVPDPAASPRDSPTPQPSSPLAWSPSPPRRDHRKVLPLPRSKVAPRQPSSQQGVVMHTSNPQLTSRTTRPAPSVPVKSRKAPEFPPVRKRRRDESDDEDNKVLRRIKSSATHHYNPCDHQQQRRSQHHPTHLPRHCSRSPPMRHSRQYTYAQSRSPVRHQYAYTRESAPIAGPSRHGTKAWVSPTEEKKSRRRRMVATIMITTKIINELR
ncbi:hypothetical protein DEU56DRAFT_907293 [Suillus clintonianus]|uniref:uncharacterized protein n=1 Tax=Suillus clintonianus TaxID=1904413 RepID=UPI001B86810C|nr:uncharacterized protein DEU56DRAFT_907293 [Suillus clintonianus]KAG2153814.1 hypothetical protein DEU56DRAFT_907293 [Suillus clintonianus]